MTDDQTMTTEDAAYLEAILALTIRHADRAPLLRAIATYTALQRVTAERDGYKAAWQTANERGDTYCAELSRFATELREANAATIDEMRANDALRAENAALRLDKERVDWLMEANHSCIPHRLGGWVAFIGARSFRGETFRAAIDAAITAPQQAEQGEEK